MANLQSTISNLECPDGRVRWGRGRQLMADGPPQGDRDSVFVLRTRSIAALGAAGAGVRQFVSTYPGGTPIA